MLHTKPVHDIVPNNENIPNEQSHCPVVSAYTFIINYKTQ